MYGRLPTLEETRDARIGCFSYFYSELERQLVELLGSACLDESG